MRLWTLHPRYLDARGLVAAWREGLLAQAVLMGKTRGYTRHPQLARFRETRSPVASIGSYLAALHEEATRRGYRFDRMLTRSSGWSQERWKPGKQAPGDESDEPDKRSRMRPRQPTAVARPNRS